MHCILGQFFHICLRLLSKLKFKHICFGAVTLFILSYFGVFTHLFEVTYTKDFSYPYDGDIYESVEALKHREKPKIDPINEYNFKFLFSSGDKCRETGNKKNKIVFLIKSAIDHYDRRLAIRNSWGFEERFYDVPMKTVFLLGTPADDDEETKLKIKSEAFKFKDVVQTDFIDSYYNNTIKTMMGFKWVMKFCSNSKFYMFVDDDIYVSVKNVLRFIRNPAHYPDYLRDLNGSRISKRDIRQSEFHAILNKMNKTNHNNENLVINKNNLDVPKSDNSDLFSKNDTHKIKDISINEQKQQISLINQQDKYYDKNVDMKYVSNRMKRIVKRQVFDTELAEGVRLFAGYVFISAPHRHKSSKWYVSLNEYPYHLWPPYVTAGAYILSKEAIEDMYYTSFYTKHFRFDDIYLGLLAKKANIEPFHCEEFHFYKKDYTKYSYKYVITSHGYHDPNELLKVWNEQKALGNA